MRLCLIQQIFGKITIQGIITSSAVIFLLSYVTEPASGELPKVRMAKMM